MELLRKLCLGTEALIETIVNTDYEGMAGFGEALQDKKDEQMAKTVGETEWIRRQAERSQDVACK